MPATIASAAPVAAPAAPVNGAAKGAPQAPVKPTVPVGAKPGDAAAPQTFKIKVEGEVLELTQAELEKYASKGKFADNAVRQARELAKAAQKAQQDAADADAKRKARAKENTEEWMREHGLDPDEFARSRLEKRVAEGKMSPEEKRAMEAEAKAAALEARLAEQDKRAQGEQQQQLTTQLERNIQSQLMAGVKRAGLETGPDTLAALHESMADMMGLNLLPMDGAGMPAHVADRIVEDAQARISESQGRLEKAVLAGLKGAALKARLGDVVYKEVLAYELEQVRSRRPGYVAKPVNGAAPTPVAPPAPKPTGYIRPSQFDAKIHELKEKHQ